jgi:hypothetical protein
VTKPCSGTRSDGHCANVWQLLIAIFGTRNLNNIKCGFISRSCVRVLGLLLAAKALARKTDVDCLIKWSLKSSSLNETLKCLHTSVLCNISQRSLLWFWSSCVCSDGSRAGRSDEQTCYVDAHSQSDGPS